MFFRRNPDEAVQKAVAQLTGAVEERRLAQDVYSCMKKVLEASTKLDNEARTRLLQQLAPLMEQATGPQAASIAIGCGAIVENGGDPHIVFPPIARHLPNMLQAAASFVDACIARHHQDSSALSNADATENDEFDDGVGELDTGEIVNLYEPEVAADMPFEAEAWLALQPLCLGAIAMLSRSPQLRRTAREHETLLPRLLKLPLHQGSVAFLKQMLQVLDEEELLVLYPGLRRGYRIRISGIADNFQLHTLLAGELIGDRPGLLPGKPLHPLTIAAAKNKPVLPRTPSAEGRFNLWTWQGLPCLQTNGKTTNELDGTEHWIWNEGVPADIPPFEGLRIILLGPPPYPRTWNPDRIFNGMTAELTVLEILPETAINEWLQRLKQ